MRPVCAPALLLCLVHLNVRDVQSICVKTFDLQSASSLLLIMAVKLQSVQEQGNPMVNQWKKSQPGLPWEADCDVP